MPQPSSKTVPLTVIIAARNEEANLRRCLQAAQPAESIVVVDSQSQDSTIEIAKQAGAKVVQFVWQGGYPKKRQWALETLSIETPWVLLLDADEVVPTELWDEIETAIDSNQNVAYLITKGFHFLGKRFRYGGFSHSAVLLFRRGTARFEQISGCPASGHDMEVHERLVVDGSIGRLATPLIHEDFKGLQAYIDRHNSYSTWEAGVRQNFLTTGRYGEDVIEPKFWGNTQERRRFLKKLAMRIPAEPACWFLYHFVLRLGFLEGRSGFIAAVLRAQYIRQVRAKIYESRKLKDRSVPAMTRAA